MGTREGLEGVDDVGAEAVDRGDVVLVRPDPEAVVAAAAEVFGEMAVESGRDRPDRFVMANRQRRECHGSSLTYVPNIGPAVGGSARAHGPD